MNKDSDLLQTLKNKRSLAKKQNQKYHSRIKDDRNYFDCEVDDSRDYPLANFAGSFIINTYMEAGQDIHLTDENPDNLEWLFISNAVLKDAEVRYGMKRTLYDMYTDFVAGGAGVIKVITEVKTKKKDLGLIDKFKNIVKTGEAEEEVVDKKILHVDSVDPLSFFPMSDAGKTLEHSCVFEKIYKSREEIEARYGITISDDEALHLSTGDKELDEGLSEGEKGAGSKVQLWICWSPYSLENKKEGGYYYLFTDNKVFKKTKMEYNPYVMFFNHKYADRKKELQPYGDIRLIKPLVEYLNDVKQDMRRYVRRVARSKWEVKKGANVDVRALRNPESGTIVEVEQMGMIKALEVPQLNPAVLQYAADVERFIEMLSGMIGGDQTMQGVSTATGQGLIAQQGGKKIGGGFDEIAWGMERVYRLILWNIYNNFDENMIIEVVGEDMIEKFRQAIEDYNVKKDLMPNPDDFKTESVRNAIKNTDNADVGGLPFMIEREMDSSKSIMVSLQKNALVEQPKIKVTILPESNKEIRLKRAIELYGLSLKDPMTDSSEVMKVVARMMDVGVDPEKFVVTKEQMAEQQMMTSQNQGLQGLGEGAGVPRLSGGGETEGDISGQAMSL